MNRREFFGLLAAAPLAALAFPKPLLPLYGDGVHDDTSAIQQRINRCEPIPFGTYMVTAPLAITNSVDFNGAHVICAHNREVLNVPAPERSINISNLWADRPYGYVGHAAVSFFDVGGI